MELPETLQTISGLLYVPLSTGGRDFIAFLRKGELREVHWAGQPKKHANASGHFLEPRASFKAWSENVIGTSRVWTDEELETAGVLALVYGKFIEVWRQKETLKRSNQLSAILLANASHEVRTPLNHIINYLELALEGNLDQETRENLTKSHRASKSLLFTINDLLEISKLESGKQVAFSEPFDLEETIHSVLSQYQAEAQRNNLTFDIDCDIDVKFVEGDAKKIGTVIGNLTANAIENTREGGITVSTRFVERLHKSDADSGVVTTMVVAETRISDTGVGIETAKLETIFRQFEQVDDTSDLSAEPSGVGLGLSMVARIVDTLGGQLKVESTVGVGSCFCFLVPLQVSSRNPGKATSTLSGSSGEIDELVDALSATHFTNTGSSHSSSLSSAHEEPVDTLPQAKPGEFRVTDSKTPIRAVRLESEATSVAKYLRNHSPSLSSTSVPTSPAANLAPPSNLSTSPSSNILDERAPKQTEPAPETKKPTISVMYVDDGQSLSFTFDLI